LDPIFSSELPPSLALFSWELTPLATLSQLIPFALVLSEWSPSTATIVELTPLLPPKLASPAVVFELPPLVLSELVARAATLLVLTLLDLVPSSLPFLDVPA